MFQKNFSSGGSFLSTIKGNCDYCSIYVNKTCDKCRSGTTQSKVFFAKDI